MEYNDQYKHEFGVEPICRTLTAAGAQIATAEYIDWFNHRRLHGELGTIPPVELEDIYHHNHPVPAPADAVLASL